MPSTSTNFIQRFIFEDLPIRGAYVTLQEEWQEILKISNYSEEVSTVLGELTASTLLLSSGMKSAERLIAQITHPTSILKMAVAEVQMEQGSFRSVAHTRETSANLTRNSIIDSSSRFIVTLQPNIWQGIVNLQECSDIAIALAHYMEQSEQISSHFLLATSNSKICGLMLQSLPEEEHHYQKQENWKRILLMCQTLTKRELLCTDIETLIYHLFPEDTLRLFPQKSFEFSCTCSKERALDLIVSLDIEETHSILAEQGSIELKCEFCQNRFVFDIEQINHALILKQNHKNLPIY
jgi:molecular chaperone Hsp33